MRSAGLFALSWVFSNDSPLSSSSFRSWQVRIEIRVQIIVYDQHSEFQGGYSFWRSLALPSHSTLALRLPLHYSMIANGLTFDGWKLRLPEDCERKDKLVAYSSLGEECLKLLWELGTEPSVQGVWMVVQKVPRYWNSYTPQNARLNERALAISLSACNDRARSEEIRRTHERNTPPVGRKGKTPNRTRSHS